MAKILRFAIKNLADTGRLTGVLLIVATIISLLLANMFVGRSYIEFWHIEIGFPFFSKSISHWINDGLMAVFFFLVGLEIRRELTKGELSTRKKAMFPLVAAIGGVIMPALIFIAFNFNTKYADGWAIPTATDIAFSLGVLSLLGSRVPFGLKILLTAVAVIDDLIAVLIIAVFYTKGISIEMLGAAGLVLLLLVVLNRTKVKLMPLYLILGIFLWVFVLKSGVHATIAGVLLAFTVPDCKIIRLEHILHKPVNYLIMPIFALANLAVSVPLNIQDIFSGLSIGIVLGLFLGKPLGIVLITYLSSKLKLIDLPKGTDYAQIIGLGFSAGIGFTMSIFISALSFDEAYIQGISKLAIIIGSVLSAVSAVFILLWNSSRKEIIKD